MTQRRETDLYPAIKAHLESMGYVVKGEIGAADVVACKDDETVIVELKLGFSLTLLHQGVARQQITDNVYVAAPRWKGKTGWRAFKANVGLAKRLGLGVISVTMGGSARVGLVTAYRQEAWRCASYLGVHGPSKGAVVAKEAEVPKATRMMAANHYGWFQKVTKGVYALTDEGQAAIAQDRAAE